MTGLTMMGAGAAACEGDACLLPASRPSAGPDPDTTGRHGAGQPAPAAYAPLPSSPSPEAESVVPVSERVSIYTPKAPAPAHTFSQGVKRGPFVQVSGQGPVDPVTGEYLFEGDVAAQTVRTLQNVEAILTAAGATFDDVMMLRVYLTKREDFAVMNDAYGEFVSARVPSGVLPARTTVFTGLPRAEMLVEIDALAVLGA